MEELGSVIKEIGLENRLIILKGLKEGAKSIAQIRKDLKKAGISKPFSTVVRYMEGLREMSLVCEDQGYFSLTLKGRLILGYAEEIAGKLDALSGFEERLCGYPVDYLPDELIRGCDVLGRAEMISDPFNVMWESVRALETAEKEVLVVNKDIINRDFGRMTFEKCHKGLRVRSVVHNDTVTPRLKLNSEILDEMGLSDEETERLKKNFLIRSGSDVSLNLVVVDERVAGVSLPDAKGENSLVPAFRSEDEGFVGWAREIFDWYWRKGEDVKW